MPVPQRRSLRLRNIAKHGASALGLLTAACANAPESTEIERLTQALDDARVETMLTGVGSFDSPGDCTGSLVDPYWVLTAGHCDKDDDHLENFLIGVGPNLSDMEVHPLDDVQYSQPSSFGKEVTLHKLKEPILNDAVPLVKLYHGAADRPWAERVPVGETCTAVGYGRYTDENGNIATGTRRSRETVIREINPEYPKTFNAGPEINPGDSGGPILCGPDKAIIGIAVSDGGQYATIDVDWIESTIKNGVPPAEPEVIDELTPEQQLLSTSGELCPEGTMELVGGGVSSRSSVLPIDQDGDGNLTCKMQLSVLIPAGKKLAMPVLCVNAHSDTPPPSAASIMYTFAEQSFPRYEWNVPGVTGPQEHCDTLAYTSATCEDPAQSHTLIFTADISVPVTEETGVSTIQVTPKLWAPDTAWTNCQ